MHGTIDAQVWGRTLSRRDNRRGVSTPHVSNLAEGIDLYYLRDVNIVGELGSGKRELGDGVWTITVDDV
jgi:hypothetical protein